MRHLRVRLLAGLLNEAGTPEQDWDVLLGTPGTVRHWAKPLPAGALRDELRRELGRRWREDAELAHRSASRVASTSLTLGHLGAPLALQRACQKASLAELCYAHMALSLAARYVGASKATELAAPTTNGPYIPCDLESLAVRLVREGCVGKALLAALSCEELRRAKDPLLRSAFRILLTHQCRQTELAYRIVAWAIDGGGESLRRAVERAFESSLEQADAAPATLKAGLDSNELNAHGRLGPFQLAHFKRLAISEVVEPCRAALLHVEEPAEVVARIAPHEPERRVRHVLPPRAFASLPTGTGS